MGLYKISDQNLEAVERTTFAEQKISERYDLQEMLKKQIEIISPNTLIVAEEFCDWKDSKRRIDLLGIDKNANLVVIELKRTEDGGYMDLQSIRYAAMISALTFEKLVLIYAEYLLKNNIDGDASQKILDFLEWDEPNEDDFAQAVRIVLASAEFSKELTTSVMWLNDLDLDITCVRMHPYISNGETFLDVQTVIPIPESTDYQIRIRKKKQKERQARSSARDTSKINIYYDGELQHERIKKADIGLMTVLTLLDKGLLDQNTFDYLREDKTCSFDLIKTKEQVTSTEEKYRKYRVSYDPDFEFLGVGYYVARNWGRNGSEKFKEKMENHFSSLKFEFIE